MEKIKNYHKSYPKNSLIMAAGGKIQKTTYGDDVTRIWITDTNRRFSHNNPKAKKEYISIKDLIELGENNKLPTTYDANANEKMVRNCLLALELMDKGKVLALDLHIVAHTYAHDTSITNLYKDENDLERAIDMYHEDEELVVEGITKVIYLLVTKTETYLLGPFENLQRQIAERLDIDL